MDRNCKLQIAKFKLQIVGWWGLIAVLGLVTGCGKPRSHQAGEAEASIEKLAVIQPKSGGEMVLIPAGSFTMGNAGGRPDETPHEVSVNSFYINVVPVTQELYEKVMGINPSKRKGKNNPVERTQWTDAVRFCNKCSELDGLTPCYNLDTWECNFEADGYRLPTEAEWECACRAGSQAKYCFGDSAGDLTRFAWFKENSGGTSKTVGQKSPNRWGLYDMHGNVWQWCNDFYGETFYAESPHDNPRGPASGKMRVLRGGAWDCDAEKCRAAYRFKEFPVYSDACFGADSYGFRRVRNGETNGKVIASEKRAGEGTKGRGGDAQQDGERERGRADDALKNTGDKSNNGRGGDRAVAPSALSPHRPLSFTER